jgi:hypothetical protein
MKQNDDYAQDKIPIQREGRKITLDLARKLLGTRADNMTDVEIAQLLNTLYSLAPIMIEAGMTEYREQKAKATK